MLGDTGKLDVGVYIISAACLPHLCLLKQVVRHPPWSLGHNVVHVKLQTPDAFAEITANPNLVIRPLIGSPTTHQHLTRVSAF
jgi:hypothetical protein